MSAVQNSRSVPSLKKCLACGTAEPKRIQYTRIYRDAGDGVIIKPSAQGRKLSPQESQVGKNPHETPKGVGN